MIKNEYCQKFIKSELFYNLNAGSKKVLGKHPDCTPSANFKILTANNRDKCLGLLPCLAAL